MLHALSFAILFEHFALRASLFAVRLLRRLLVVQSLTTCVYVI